MEPLLRIEDLTVHFETNRGLVEALDGVNLSIDRGEVVSIVGESGCGKTTLARSALNVIPSPPGRIVKGKVIFNNRNILNMSGAEFNSTIRGKAVTLIPQDPFSSFNPLFTIGTQIRDIACTKFKRSRKEALGSSSISNETNERIEEMLKRVQLPSPNQLLRKYPHEVSGGQRQRIMIAMALLPNPDLVIADEPTTFLDVTIQAQITSILSHLVSEQIVSVLYITHDLAVASKIGDRIVVMYAGQEVEMAPTASLFISPYHPYTKKLLECLPSPDGIIHDIPGRVPSLIGPPRGCRFHLRCDRTVKQCREDKPPLTEIESKHWIRCYNPYGNRATSLS